MGRLLILLFIYFFLSFHLSAQGVKQPQQKNEQGRSMGQYRFPNFTEGTIVFRNGIMLSEKLNYNISADEMHFIDKNGDTLAIANVATVNFISMNGSRFYYNKGYLQVLDTAKGIMLAFRQSLKNEEDQSSDYTIINLRPNEWATKPAAASETNNKPGAADNISLDAKESYFLGDGNSDFVKANKDYILDHFKEHQPAIKAFLKANHTNFNALADLLILFQFCKKL